MRFTVVIAFVLLLGVVASAKDLNLDEIESIDTSVFGENAASKPSDSLQSALSRAEDNEKVAERGVEDAIADSTADAEGEDATLYSFRAMSEATTLAGTSVSEKADETHAISARFISNEDNADKMFAEINREQQILMAKKALVARQKQSISDSEESLHKLENLIDENKSILRKNQRALRRASNDLIRLIAKYQLKLRAGLSNGGSIDGLDHLLHLSTEHEDEDDDNDSHTDGDEVKKLPTQKAAVATPQTADSTIVKKTAAPKKAVKKAAPKKMTFSQLHHSHADSEEADTEEAEESEEAEEVDEEEEESDEESDESEENDEADEEEEEEDSDEEEAADNEEEEEDSSSSFIERDTPADRESVLAGLPPPPQWEMDVNA